MTKNNTYVCPRCKAFMKINGICKKCGYTENKLLIAKGRKKYGKQ